MRPFERIRREVKREYQYAFIERSSVGTTDQDAHCGETLRHEIEVHNFSVFEIDVKLTSTYHCSQVPANYVGGSSTWTDERSANPNGDNGYKVVFANSLEVGAPGNASVLPQEAECRVNTRVKEAELDRAPWVRSDSCTDRFRIS